MENYSNFDEYLESEYHILPSTSIYDYYEDNAGNIWNLTDIKKEYYHIKSNKTFNYSEMLKKCGVEL
jgi:hypothetical protein